MQETFKGGFVVITSQSLRRSNYWLQAYLFFISLNFIFSLENLSTSMDESELPSSAFPQESREILTQQN